MYLMLKELFGNAASAKTGRALREILERAIDNGEKVEIDFSGVHRYAGPFFNNSLAALVVERGSSVLELISTENLSPVGEQVLKDSIENAKRFEQGG